jgi:hypothetical protein
MSELTNYITSVNLVSLLIGLFIAVSAWAGFKRGASGSARVFMALLAEGAITLLSLAIAWRLAQWGSPVLQDWLIARNIELPQEQVGVLKQIYYTVVTGIRDFPLLRVGLIFLVCYVLLKNLLFNVWYGLSGPIGRLVARYPGPQAANPLSSIVGAAIGLLIGAGKALLLVAVLFVYTTLFPQAPFNEYIQASGLYQKGAQVIEPITGDLVADQLPVFTRAVEEEFGKILQRKYEVLDAAIPDEIALAAKEITKQAQTDEQKARYLYQWVGTRVAYDWNKVKMYEEQQVWLEQTPEQTFSTRKGVCIDYSRLYAMMARAVDLEVKVVTGLGYNGQGGYGPHAWNEVFLAEGGKWVPVDTTWVSSGGNWFNPPDFDKTHIKDA